jgi:hypothetical protein
MPQNRDRAHDWSEPPKNWAEQEARRIALEVRRLRGKRSAQWLATRTADLGSEVTRSVISDLEVGRRRYVTTAELVILARALDTAPIALLYPAPYRDTVQVLPAPEGAEVRDIDKILAVQWFSGVQGTYLDHVGIPFIDQANYHSQLLALVRAREAFELEERRQRLAVNLAALRRDKKDAPNEVSDKEIDELVSDISYLQDRISQLWELGPMRRPESAGSASGSPSPLQCPRSGLGSA